MLRQAFRDAQQVEVTAGSCAGTAGKVSSEKFSYTPLPRACDSTTADFVAMRPPGPGRLMSRRCQVDRSLCISAGHSTASGSVRVKPRVGRGGEVRQDAIAVFSNGIGRRDVRRSGA